MIPNSFASALSPSEILFSAVAAARSLLYRGGWVEPRDSVARQAFAEAHVAPNAARWERDRRIGLLQVVAMCSLVAECLGSIKQLLHLSGDYLRAGKSIHALAKHVEKMPMVVPASVTKEGEADLENGMILFQERCMECHRYNATGEMTFGSPPLVGRQDWYLLAQLMKFKNLHRGTAKGDEKGAPSWGRSTAEGGGAWKGGAL